MLDLLQLFAPVILPNESVTFNKTTTTYVLFFSKHLENVHEPLLQLEIVTRSLTTGSFGLKSARSFTQGRTFVFVCRVRDGDGRGKVQMCVGPVCRVTP